MAIGFLPAGRATILGAAPTCPFGKPFLADRTLNELNGLVGRLVKPNQHTPQIWMEVVVYAGGLQELGQPVLELAAFEEAQL